MLVVNSLFEMRFQPVKQILVSGNYRKLKKTRLDAWFYGCEWLHWFPRVGSSSGLDRTERSALWHSLPDIVNALSEQWTQKVPLRRANVSVYGRSQF
jgi:hypothetical protein